MCSLRVDQSQAHRTYLLLRNNIDQAYALLIHHHICLHQITVSHFISKFFFSWQRVARYANFLPLFKVLLSSTILTS